MSNRHYRGRPQKSIIDDLLWLKNARDRFREADEASFTKNATWPLRAAQMDRVVRALGLLQHTLFNAIEEAQAELTGEPVRELPHDDNNWLSYPPPRR